MHLFSATLAYPKFRAAIHPNTLDVIAHSSGACFTDSPKGTLCIDYMHEARLAAGPGKIAPDLVLQGDDHLSVLVVIECFFNPELAPVYGFKAASGAKPDLFYVIARIGFLVGSGAPADFDALRHDCLEKDYRIEQRERLVIHYDTPVANWRNYCLRKQYQL